MLSKHLQSEMRYRPGCLCRTFSFLKKRLETIVLFLMMSLKNSGIFCDGATERGKRTGRAQNVVSLLPLRFSSLKERGNRIYKNFLKFGIKTVRAIPGNARQFTSRLYIGFIYRFYDNVVSNV